MLYTTLYMVKTGKVCKFVKLQSDKVGCATVHLEGLVYYRVGCKPTKANKFCAIYDDKGILVGY